jgi:hypothetical protein
MRTSGEALSIGWFFAAAIVIGYFIGAFLDTRFGWAPWGTMGGVLLGVGAGFQNLIQFATRLNRAEEERQAEARTAMGTEAQPRWRNLDEPDVAEPGHHPEDGDAEDDGEAGRSEDDRT